MKAPGKKSCRLKAQVLRGKKDSKKSKIPNRFELSASSLNIDFPDSLLESCFPAIVCTSSYARLFIIAISRSCVAYIYRVCMISFTYVTFTSWNILEIKFGAVCAEIEEGEKKTNVTPETEKTRLSHRGSVVFSNGIADETRCIAAAPNDRILSRFLSRRERLKSPPPGRMMV